MCVISYRWNKYTLANVVDSHASDWGKKLWLPAIMSYVFVSYACYLLYVEYQHFVLKRLEYLIEGDPDTQTQTHYTVMVENIPVEVRSGPQLKTFFERLFPGGTLVATYYPPDTLLPHTHTSQGSNGGWVVGRNVG